MATDLDFTAIPGDEHYLASAKDALFSRVLPEALGHAFIFNSVTSTMDAAERFVLEGVTALPEASSAHQSFACGNAVFLSASQLKGRGRKSRPWHSAPMEGMYLTYLLEQKVKQPSWPSITLVMGLAVLETARRFGGEYRLKWPNDVLALSPEHQQWRKLSGILTEALGADSRFLSVGIGINIAQQRFPEDVPGVSLAQASGASVNYFEVLGVLTERVLSLYEEFSRNGFPAFQRRWWDNSLMEGAEAEVEQLGQEPCRVLSLAADGGLVVAAPSGRTTIYAGDITLSSEHALRIR